MRKIDFSYEGYCDIVRPFAERVVDFQDAGNLDSFALIRHDVEFNLGRALDMARIDSNLNIASSFLLQVKSDAYNLASVQSRRIVDEIVETGCFIGLHFYVSHVPEGDAIMLHDELQTQAELFWKATGVSCDRFSFHRPPRWVLEMREDYVCGLLNMYGPSFFEFSPSPSSIKYCADSLHRFKYGHPLDNLDKKKIQLLFHPDEWSDIDTNEVQNFRRLEAEHAASFCRTLLRETPANYVLP